MSRKKQSSDKAPKQEANVEAKVEVPVAPRPPINKTAEFEQPPTKEIKVKDFNKPKKMTRKDFKELIERYKEQNPEKAALKEEELKAKLAAYN